MAEEAGVSVALRGSRSVIPFIRSALTGIKAHGLNDYGRSRVCILIMLRCDYGHGMFL